LTRLSFRTRITIALVSWIVAIACGCFALAGLRGESSGREALAAAQTAVPTLLSYNIARLDDDLAKGVSLTTGQFATDYRSLVSDTLESAARTKQVVTTATVSASGIVSVNHDDVVVLMFINRQASNVDVPTTHLDISTVKVTMRDVSGRWLIADMEPV
jgi:Mce-associated membrane protein